jgi:hypothetical protein
MGVSGRAFFRILTVLLTLDELSCREMKKVAGRMAQ